MQREDIIQMAREAGFHTKCFAKDEVLLVAKHSNGSWIGLDEELERFAQLVAAAEREACAKVCENLFQAERPYEIYAEASQDCATAIRARGQA